MDKYALLREAVEVVTETLRFEEAAFLPPARENSGYEATDKIIKAEIVRLRRQMIDVLARLG